MIDQPIDKQRQLIGAKLKANRSAWHITQMNISLHSGLSMKTIVRIEKGKLPYTIDTVLRYIDSLRSLVESSAKHRSKSKQYTLPIILDLDMIIFQINKL